MRQTTDRVDFQAIVLTFESKQKRRPGLYRAVPVPATLLDALDLVHGLRDRATRTQRWTWSLKTAYTRVIEIMARAKAQGKRISRAPIARPIQTQIARQSAQGASISHISKQLGIGYGAAWNYVQRLKAVHPVNTSAGTMA